MFFDYLLHVWWSYIGSGETIEGGDFFQKSLMRWDTWRILKSKCLLSSCMWRDATRSFLKKTICQLYKYILFCSWNFIMIIYQTFYGQLLSSCSSTRSIDLPLIWYNIFANLWGIGPATSSFLWLYAHPNKKRIAFLRHIPFKKFNLFYSYLNVTIANKEWQFIPSYIY